MHVFRASLSDRPEIEVWNHLCAYLFRCCRHRFETIPSYIVREAMLRERALRALKLVDAKIEEVIHPSIRAYLLLECVGRRPGSRERAQYVREHV